MGNNFMKILSSLILSIYSTLDFTYFLGNAFLARFLFNVQKPDSLFRLDLEFESDQVVWSDWDDNQDISIKQPGPLSLVESFIVLKYFHSVATPCSRNAKCPQHGGLFVPFAGSLWHKDRWLTCLLGAALMHRKNISRLRGDIDMDQSVIQS